MLPHGAAQEGTERRFAMQVGGATVYGLREYVFARFDKRSQDFWEPPKDEEDDAAAELSAAEAAEDAPAFL